MRLKPPLYLQSAYAPGATVVASRSVAQGELDAPLQFKRLPSWKLAKHLCAGAGVNVSLKGLRSRRPKRLGQETGKGYDDRVFRELVIAAVIYQLSSNSDKCEGVELSLASRESDMEVQLCVTFFGRTDEHFVRGLLAATDTSNLPEVEFEGSGAVQSLSDDSDVFPEDELLQAFLVSCVRENPILISWRVKNRRPEVQLAPLLVFNLGRTLREFFGAK